MILKGILVDLLANIYPMLYSKYVALEKGVKVLYVNIQKSLYNLLRSTLLIYIKLATDLEKDGFVINMHEPCVTKKRRRGGYDSVKEY